MRGDRGRPPRRPGGPADPRTARDGRTLRLGEPRRRILVAAGLTAVLLLVYGGRLVQVQAVQASPVAAQAAESMLTAQTLPAVRGSITDSNGVVLATSVPAVDVTADQTLVHDPGATAALLAPVLGQPVATLTALLTGRSHFVYLARQVSPAMWAKVAALDLVGIFHNDTVRRIYPDGTLAANVLGYVGIDGRGLGGLELQYNSLLSGTPGSATYETGPSGQQIPAPSDSDTPAVNGSTLRLTINRDIQWVAQQAIDADVVTAHADSGYVIVENVHTGQILAMAVSPDFNPNDLAAADPATLGNPAVSDIYEPGSTAKVMTAAAVLQQRTLTPGSHLVVPGELLRGGYYFHDDTPHGTEQLTLTGVLARSSNIGAIEASETISPSALYHFQKAFGLGQPTGLDFPGESDGLEPDLPTASIAQQATAAFGQGISVTAVQATSVFATIANDGVRVQPSLVEGYTDASGVYHPAAAPRRTRVIDASVAATLRGMLESVVSDEGTAPLAAIPGYQVAGKTGTANRINPNCGCYQGYTASFIGMAPADRPDLVISVTLQNPRVALHFGGTLGAPVFAKVMSFALQTLGVPPTGARPPQYPVTWP